MSSENKQTDSNSDFKELFGDMFEALPGAVLVWGRDRRVVAINPQFEEAFGITAADLIGGAAEQVDESISGRVAEPDFVRKVIKEARANTRSDNAAVCHVLPLDGLEERYLECSVKMVTGGLLEGYMIEYYKDIDQVVKSGQEQHMLQKTLIQSQKLEVVGTMSAGIFHDLNNILAIISGYTQMLKVNPAASDKYLRKIGDSCGIMERIIKQAMEFATSEQGVFMTCDLSKVVDESLELLRHCIPKRIELAWEKPENMPAIKANPTQLFQLMMNLCLNAAQAIDDKGKISVDLVLEEPADGDSDQQRISLVVRDSGCGMGDKTHNRLFHPFFSKHHSHQGRGLGLYVVQQILNLHDAVIDVSSERGEGTRIAASFPVIAK